jgi:hypothetical protein
MRGKKLIESCTAAVNAPEAVPAIRCYWLVQNLVANRTLHLQPQRLRDSLGHDVQKMQENIKKS